MSAKAASALTPGESRADAAEPSRMLDIVACMLAQPDVKLNGDRRWDIQVHDRRMARRILAQGSLGLGESYMESWWDCDALDELICRILRARLDERVSPRLVWHSLRARLFNLQSVRRAWQVGQAHYDLGNDFFAAMLDSRMTYTCGYWASATNLEDAQAAKLDLICRKLGLRPGMRLLDIGCGWGSLMKFAARYYGVACVGLTISREQAAHVRENREGLPIEAHLSARNSGEAPMMSPVRSRPFFKTRCR